MKYCVLLITVLTFTMQVNAQNYNLPPNPKAGKCYERCFDYNKKFEWKIVECSKVNGQKTEKTAVELLEIQQEISKMKTYQEKLKSLGYKLDITGVADNKTIIAHHKYLRKKKKADKKLKKKLQKDS